MLPFKNNQGKILSTFPSAFPNKHNFITIAFISIDLRGHPPTSTYTHAIRSRKIKNS